MAPGPWPIRHARLAWAIAAVFVVGACASGGPPAGSRADATETPDATEPADATDGDLATAEPATTSGDQTPSPTDPNDIGTDRPSMVTMSISNANFQDADGSYSASGMTRDCGNASFVFTGSLSGFDYGFPHDIPAPAKPQIGDVTFHARDLPAGASTSQFSLSVNVVNATGQEPPSISIQPGTIDGDSGSAQRTESNGTTTLTLDATGNAGDHVTLTATCGPRSG